MILVSSNENKLKEFQRFGLEDIMIEKGIDLREVDSDEETVIIYKALAAGPGRIVEDTSLFVEGASIGVHIRWLLDNLSDFAGAEAIWKVYLGVNNGKSISVFKGEIYGMIVENDLDETGFGFDAFFVPNSSGGNTLLSLEKVGLKDTYSARKRAVDSLLLNKPIKCIPIKSIKEWTGKYQK